MGWVKAHNDMPMFGSRISWRGLQQGLESVGRFLGFTLFINLMIACSPQSFTDEVFVDEIIVQTDSPTLNMPTTEVIPTDTRVSPTDLPPPTITPSLAVTTLRLWFPEPLAPIDNEDAAELLSQQISAFQTANPDIRIDFRLKRSNDVGGIMSTLMSANVVAPDALPDLTLFRRTDLVNAAEIGLIESIDAVLPVTLLNDLPASVIALGQVNEQVMGMPYALEVAHFAYHRDAVTLSTSTFDEYLSLEIPFIAPLAQTNGISDVLLIQILAAGGMITEDGGLQISSEALGRVFSFYSDESQAGLLPPEVLEYISVSDYRVLLAQGGMTAAFVRSTDYLTLIDSGLSLSFAAIPSSTGDSLTVMDGWMWAMTTSDFERQRAAVRFLTWMLDPERQAQYTQSVAYIPSQQNALSMWSESTYTAFLTELVESGVVPLGGSESTTTARVLQLALASVINGQQTAQQAAREAVAQLSGDG